MGKKLFVIFCFLILISTTGASTITFFQSTSRRETTASTTIASTKIEPTTAKFTTHDETTLTTTLTLIITTAPRGDVLSVSTAYLLNELSVDGVDWPVATNDFPLASNNTRLYTFVATVPANSDCVGLIASVTNDYMVTSSKSCKCSTSPGDGYTKLGFDDSSWRSAFEYGGPVANYCGQVAYPRISANAKWIWSDNSSTSREVSFCRCYSTLCEKSNPCKNGGICNQNSEKICSCTNLWTGEFCELQRTADLAVTAKDALSSLYVDGIAIGVSNSNYWNLSMTAKIDPYARLVAISALNTGDICSGILASVDGAYYRTDRSWKCTAVSYNNWFSPYYNDSGWSDATVVGDNANGLVTCPFAKGVVGIDANSQWIWTDDQAHAVVYCRGHLPVCSYYLPCQNGGQCNSNAGSLCRCLPGYTGSYCEIALNVAFSLTGLYNLGGVYLDGVQQNYLPYGSDYNRVDVINRIDPQVRAVSVFVHASSATNNSCIGLIGDITMQYNALLTVTNGSWNCIDTQQIGWYKLGFNSNAPAAKVVGDNGVLSGCPARYYSEINPSAKWIWFSSTNYVTSFCTVLLPVCDSKPCQNDGVCNPNSLALCTCKNGFSGRFCEISPTLYSASGLNVPKCGTNGYQVYKHSKLTCVCRPGFTGDLCNDVIERCSLNSCNGRGRCRNRDFGIFCVCYKGFSGANCDKVDV